MKKETEANGYTFVYGHALDVTRYWGGDGGLHLDSRSQLPLREQVFKVSEPTFMALRTDIARIRDFE